MASSSAGKKPENITPGAWREQPARKLQPDIPHILPHEKVFPIQIGSELFRLSGASISSDGQAPSYFSSFFRLQLDKAEQEGETDAASVRTLYIDRDPVTFQDISRHLQGYYIQPRDGTHFVKLFADAQFYQLPRLVDQLYEESIYISIGDREFKVPKDIFSNPGDSPNYFTLGFAFLFSSPSEIFPGLNRDGLLRPPSILPPAIPNRSAEIFAELLHLLRGYPLHIRNEEHRAELLRDCRYFLFRGLEQKLIPHHISFNLLRRREEITIRLEDIRQPGLSVVSDPSIGDGRPGIYGWVNYARQYVDDRPYELVVEISNEWTKINTQTMRAEFFGDGKTRISRLFEVVANKLNLPTTQPLGLLMVAGGASSQPASPGNTPISEDHVKIMFDNASVTLDGRPYHRSTSASTDAFPSGYFDEESTPIPTPTASYSYDEPAHSSTQSHHSTSRSPSTSTPNPLSATTQTHPYPQSAAAGPPPRKRKRPLLGVPGLGVSEPAEPGMWTVRAGQWRLRVQSANNGKSGIECVLVAVKLEAFTSELARNEGRGFLGS